MLVKDLMITDLIVINEETSIEDTRKLLVEKNILSAPVVNADHKLEGIITNEIIFNAFQNKIDPSTSVKSIMSRKYNVVTENEDINIINTMPMEYGIVTNGDNEIIGAIRKRFLIDNYSDKLEQAITELETIINSTQNGIIAINNEGNITVFNSVAKEIIGIPADDKIIGENILKYNPLTRLLKIANTKASYSNKIIDYKNRKLLINSSPVIKGGQIVGAVSIFDDITDYKRIEEQLQIERNEVEILNTILEIAHDGIVVIDKNGIITMMSEAYKRFINLKDRDKNVIGKHISEVIDNTRMHIVAKTGIAEIAKLQKQGDDYMVVSRIPIYKNGEVASVVGKIIFKNVNELEDLNKRIKQVEEELEHYKDEISKLNNAKYDLHSIIGDSKEMRSIKSLVRKVSNTNSNVLILGESGTGKELFAHAIHSESNRRKRPFIQVNCAAIPSELLESELFGYEAGAFTGAKRNGKIGKFEVANGGTIFLDEIGDMPLEMQSKLLRVLQEREIERVGSNISKKIDVRVVVATNRDLEEMVKERTFRLDLYYRINVVTLKVPPLRERKEDIRALAESFAYSLSSKYNKGVIGISKEAMQILEENDWPGNIRELENVIERAINIIEDEDTIEVKHFPAHLVGEAHIKEIRPLKVLMDEAEKGIILQYLRYFKNNKTKTAKALNISRTALYEKIEKYESE